MRQAQVLYKNEEAGVLIQLDDASFIFRYNDLWYQDSSRPPISLSFPKNQQEYQSKYLFPFFFNMLPEGSNKKVVCYTMRIDEEDHFSLLINTAKYDTIGAVRIVNPKTHGRA